VNVGFDLSIHISFLLTTIISHGTVSWDFVISTVILFMRREFVICQTVRTFVVFSLMKNV